MQGMNLTAAPEQGAEESPPTNASFAGIYAVQSELKRATPGREFLRGKATAQKRYGPLARMKRRILLRGRRANLPTQVRPLV